MSKFGWTPGVPQRLCVNNVTLEAICYGPAPREAPTIVMLHEGLGCVTLWRQFPEMLMKSTGFGVFLWSRAGYGKSDPIPLPRPLDYMIREAEDILPHILDQIPFERGVLLGHSDGASIAASYAGGVQDFRVRGLVLMAPHFFAEPMGLAAIACARKEYDTGSLRPRLAKYHDHVDVAFRGWSEAWLDPGFETWSIADCIDYLRIPALVIQGVRDEYGTSRQIDEIVDRSYAPVDVAMIDDCGHAPYLERPEQTLAAIADFCRRLERIEKVAPR